MSISWMESATCARLGVPSAENMSSVVVSLSTTPANEMPCLPHLKRTKGGRLVGLSSTGSVVSVGDTIRWRCLTQVSMTLSVLSVVSKMRVMSSLDGSLDWYSALTSRFFMSTFHLPPSVSFRSVGLNCTKNALEPSEIAAADFASSASSR